MRTGASMTPKTSRFGKHVLILHFALAIKLATGFTAQPLSIIRHALTSRRYPIDKPVAVCLRSTSDIEYNIQQSALLDDVLPTGTIIVLAIVLGFLSQILINSMLKGDQGLSAFLSDGKGYGKSKFRPYTKGKDLKKKDPLPWLKLPKFDYVEVAGQENDTGIDDLEKDKFRDLEMITGSG
eukprot:CAMPEP_0176504838 /NCGR_PEP_ID=MMETSP0200_2-20121128/16165_1 /TAXON_ID=947934 /ORGANISM="Chaetoceros sp., Strain GSL56" /LENGTH=180 /DNA_ID=CAMNT_0017904333 /DNA_START=137 /DNA_END=679 /DNA_ORIENTATION=-